jgi:1-acyl-sn-glycerol-3-phosphate acyltransferase
VPLRPTAENLRVIERNQRLVRPLIRALLSLRVRCDVVGQQHVPAAGGALLVANHVTLLDVPLVGAATDRALVWLGTATLAEGRAAGLLDRLGLVTKRRFDPDLGAVRALRRWVAHGGAVALFPEGERTWDGRLLPLQPGIGALVRLLGVPVVPVTLRGAYRVWPRWTPKPHRGRVEVRFHAPRTWGAGADREEIEAELREALAVDPADVGAVQPRGPLAAGLANLLFRCLSCGAPDPEERDDALSCGCGARWTLDPAHRLTGPSGEVLTLQAAVDRVTAAAEAAFLALDGDVVLQSEPVELVEHGVGPVGTGTLTLRRDRLALERDGGTVRAFDLAALRNVNVEYTRQLEVRTATARYLAVIPTGSAWQWPWAVRWWAERGRGGRVPA